MAVMFCWLLLISVSFFVNRPKLVLSALVTCQLVCQTLDLMWGLRESKSTDKAGTRALATFLLLTFWRLLDVLRAGSIFASIGTSSLRPEGRLSASISLSRCLVPLDLHHHRAMCCSLLLVLFVHTLVLLDHLSLLPPSVSLRHLPLCCPSSRHPLVVAVPSWASI